MNDVFCPIMTRVDDMNNRNLSSINTVSNMPLGNKTAVVTQKLDDDDLSTEQRDPIIADSKTRNSQYNEQQLTYNKRNLVGKKSNVVSTSIFDQQAIQSFNERNEDKATALEYRIDKESHWNFVSFPFTQAEPTIIFK
jgi:hypothetical protein